MINHVDDHISFYCLFILDPMAEGVKISDGMIGGILGGGLFLLVAIILAVIAVKIFNKRKQREKAMRYGKFTFQFWAFKTSSETFLIFIMTLKLLFLQAM